MVDSDKFFITRDQLNMTSDQFEKGDDHKWSQNRLALVRNSKRRSEAIFSLPLEYYLGSYLFNCFFS